MIKKPLPTKKEFQTDYNGFKIRNFGKCYAVLVNGNTTTGNAEEIKAFIKSNGGDTGQVEWPAKQFAFFIP